MIRDDAGQPVWTPTTTLELIDRATEARPSAAALSCEERQLTYEQYRHCVEVLAARLSVHPPGGRIVIALRNGLAICIALFACQRAGLLPATLNPDYTAHELQPMLEDAEPSLVIAHAELAGRFPGQTLLLIEDDWSFVAELLAAHPSRSLPPVSPDRDAVLQFTGGTTGRPKGVLLTHRAVATNVAQREARLPTLFGDERIVCAMPLFHVFAVAMGLHMAAYAAGTLVILPRYRPDHLLDAVERHRATRLPAGPTMLQSLLGCDALQRERLSSLRCCYSGSAPLSVATLERWEAATGVPIFEGYGQSEAGPVVTYSGPVSPAPPGTVGRALSLTELRIVDPLSLQPLGPGQQGEILARGPQLMRGYLDNPEATAETLRDGWLHTGDIGRLDPDGLLTIADRKKDMAIVGGFNVYPREVDEALMAHPGIVEAAALGIADAYRGETIQAWVVGSEDLTREAVDYWCEQRLVRYKRPTAIHFVEALPRTAAGKIDKAAIRGSILKERSLVA